MNSIISISIQLSQSILIMRKFTQYFRIVILSNFIGEFFSFSFSTFRLSFCFELYFEWVFYFEVKRVWVFIFRFLLFFIFFPFFASVFLLFFLDILGSVHSELSFSSAKDIDLERASEYSGFFKIKELTLIGVNYLVYTLSSFFSS